MGLIGSIIEKLDLLDKKLLLYINSHHTPFWDDVMILLSEKLVWIPLYALLVGFLIWKFKKRSWLYLISIVLLITVADQFASTIMKPLVTRLRPCHDHDLEPFLYLAKGCGGLYGFVSSHAANTFALACFFSLVIKNIPATLLLYFWAASVSFSRIYLGAHYPGDIIGGGLAGIIIGIIFYRLHLRISTIVFKEKLEG